MLRLTHRLILGDLTLPKISTLANIAFDIKSPYKNIHIEGIDSIENMDIDYASELGYKIKHIATARSNDSQIEAKPSCFG